MTALSPVNLNLTDSSFSNTGKYYQTVLNTDDDSIKLDYRLTGARGYIKNEKTYLSKQGEYSVTDFNCSPLSLESKTDQSYFSGFYSNNRDEINSKATKIELGKSSEKASCTEKDLEKIKKQSEVVFDLPNNENYVKVSAVKGKEILQNIMPFSCISRNFYDASDSIFKKERGQYAISIKLF